MKRLSMFVIEIRKGMRQIERWIIAAKQDSNPGIKLLHANYAVGNLDMLRQMFTDSEIKEATSKDPALLMSVAINLQDEAQSEIEYECPSIMPS